jgi:hypothetical protein
MRANPTGPAAAKVQNLRRQQQQQTNQQQQHAET